MILDEDALAQLRSLLLSAANSSLRIIDPDLSASLRAAADDLHTPESRARLNEMRARLDASRGINQ